MADSFSSRTALSRDSWPVQRDGHSLGVERLDSAEDFVIEVFDIVEGLVGEAMGLEIAPDRFDVVEFGGVFGQPLDA